MTLPLRSVITTLAVICLAIPQETTAQLRSNPRSPRQQTIRPTPSAGRSQTPNPADKTELKVELLTGEAGNGIIAQRWAGVFREMGVRFRIRRAVLNDKPETSEQQVGTLRYVTVKGTLDRSGRIQFADRAFTRNDTDKMTEWFAGLKTYGAQGSPAGQPAWGLSKKQFSALHGELSRPLKLSTHGLKLEEALQNFPLPRQHPLRTTIATRSWLRTEFTGDTTVRQELEGLSTGTALAILLNDYGLGFRPLRTPQGQIEITVDPLSKTTDVWPIGWDLTKSRPETAPELFKLIPVEFDGVRLLDVTTAISTKTGVPILYDHFRIEAADIKLPTLTATHPSRKTSWSLMLRRITTPHKLTRRLRIDEQGTPFVWITTLQPR